MLGIDTETLLITAECVPPPVCVSTSEGGLILAKVLRCCQLAPLLREWVAHNAAFDALVIGQEWPDLLDEIWEAHYRGDVYCTATRQKMLTTADADCMGKAHYGGTSLADCVKLYLSVEIGGKEESDWRYRYAELMDTPVTEWPKEASEYAIDDAKWGLEVFSRQNERDK